MTVGNVISICASIISIIAIVATVWGVRYQIAKAQKFECEKIKLEIFADFIAICGRRLHPDFDTTHMTRLYNLFAKLQLTSNKEICDLASKLFDIVSESNRNDEELTKCLTEIKYLMRKSLKTFNTQYKSIKK